MVQLLEELPPELQAHIAGSCSSAGFLSEEPVGLPAAELQSPSTPGWLKEAGARLSDAAKSQGLSPAAAPDQHRIPPLPMPFDGASRAHSPRSPRQPPAACNRRAATPLPMP